MRNALVFAVFLALLLRADGETDVLVRFTNVLPGKGAIVLQLFDTPNTFADLRDPAKEFTFPNDGRAVYRLSGIAPGEYALLAFLDENENGVLDRNFIGIPREPVGFANRYRPKGPPSYPRARFSVDAGVPGTLDIELARPLGRLGRVGVGVGVIGQSSPYRGSEKTVMQIIPAVTYIGDRVQVFGPTVQVGLAGTGNVRLAVAARYRLGAYEEEDSPVLHGLGDRKATVMAGLAAEIDLPAGFDVSLRIDNDVADRIGGGSGRLAAGKSFQWGIARVSPGLAVNGLSSALAAHDYGVPRHAARVGRPAYRPGAVLSLEAGVRTTVDLGKDWMFLLEISLEQLDKDVRRSPIVDEQRLWKGFAAVNYVF